MKDIKNKIIIAAVMVCLVAATSAISFFISFKIFENKSIVEPSTKISFDGENVDLSKIAKFQEVKRRIDESFYMEYDENDLIEGAIKGMVEALGDPYTQYIQKEDMDDRNNHIKGQYYGVGATIINDGEKLTITEVKPNSPAEESGLKVNDIILKIDDKSISDYTSDELNSLFKEDGRKIKFSIDRSGETVEAEITVSIIVEQSVVSRKLDDETGYIQILMFDTKASSEFESQLNILMGQDIKQLVIDLRNNGGGLANEMSKIADTILPDGALIYSEKDKNGKEINVKYSDERSVNIPIVVLINGNTASASEILSSALRDSNKAILVGEKSFGKAISQQTISMGDDGSGLVITVSQYYTASGKNIQGEGLVPDAIVEPLEEYKNSDIKDIPADKDVQLAKAVELVKDLGKDD